MEYPFEYAKTVSNLRINSIRKSGLISFFTCILMISCTSGKREFLIPVDTGDRTSTRDLRLTEIGDFGLQRKDRPGIPGHLHTGIDIKRPSGNYIHEPIFPIAQGRIISKRSDGPYAQLILEHMSENDTFWTVYEHIAEIMVELGQEVGVNHELARYFNKQELDKHGWQFDHFHFEILRIRPKKIRPNRTTPYRHFQSYTLECYTEEHLLEYFYDPITFLEQNNDE